MIDMKKIRATWYGPDGKSKSSETEYESTQTAIQNALSAGSSMDGVAVTGDHTLASIWRKGNLVARYTLID